MTDTIMPIEHLTFDEVFPIENADDPFFILHKIINNWKATKFVSSKDDHGVMYSGTLPDHELEWLYRKVKRTIEFSLKNV